MQKINLLFLLFLLILTACNNKSNNSFNEKDFSWKDDQVFAYTDINNPSQGFSIGDKEALDTAFAAYILKVTGNTDLKYTDTEGNIISAKDAEALLTQTHITLNPDPTDPEVMMEEIQEVKLNTEDVVQVLCRESWYLDEEKFILTKKVSHIAPIVYAYDHEGDVRGKKILYWIELNSENK